LKRHAERISFDMTHHANRYDAQAAGSFEARGSDWRNGAVTYQVLVDRFAPSAQLEAKQHLYPAPKRLRDWSELPRQGHYLEEARVWSHELDFWGGDLQSLRARLQHIIDLGADVLYLNPICKAYTNHKYDALDYAEVSPEYGTRQDVKALAEDLHRHGMKLVLDGVFNHMGRNAPRFQDAKGNPASPWRNWFIFGEGMPGGARSWMQAENLPELNMEHPAVQAWLWGDRDSVVRSYLRDGVDGWRLDVAHDIGMDLLHALTQAAHDEKPGSLVVGELWNWPKEWFPAVDGVMNFSLREIILRTLSGRLPPATAMRMIHRMVQDCGIEPLLKSWLMLDNHDTIRLADALPDERARRMAQLLQFTLPGAPNLYYGSELGMTGGADPEMRAPMQWDMVRDDNPTLQWTRQLVTLRRNQLALRVGDWRAAECNRLLAFERHTDRVADTVLILANPSDRAIEEDVLFANSKLMNNSPIRDLLEPGRGHKPFIAGFLEASLEPWEVRVLQPDVQPIEGYTTYKRVR
jgi:glycosidase